MGATMGLPSEQELICVLRRNALTSRELADRFKAKIRPINRMIKDLKERGFMIIKTGERWVVAKNPITKNQSDVATFPSEDDNTYLFGFIGDTHLCSKYERLDVLEKLYDLYAEEGVSRVYHTGNWIDGECDYNRFDLKVHGLDDQCSYFAENYPVRDGVETYAVAGDDHEGWWSKKIGIDIGIHMQNVMREHGRTDWHHLGYMEAFVPLKNSNTGKTAQMLVQHPGGGSSYAISYRPQKIVESFAGGEKPAILLIGHYHKLSYNIIRHVHAIQTGSTQDQTPFMRKKGIDSHVGAGICKVRQNPESGAISSCRLEFFQYFNRGHYNKRWNYSGVVNLPERVQEE